MENLFPQALLACIGEDRAPDPREFATIVDKIRQEVFPRGLGDDDRSKALNYARVALAGERHVA